MRERNRWMDMGVMGEREEGRGKNNNSIRNEKEKINKEYTHFKI